MSALVRKEIRLLFPYWAIAMSLGVVLSLVLARDIYGSSNQYFFVAFGFAVVLLGLAPFGYEFSAGTFSSLMVQPMDRWRIWRLKILTTGLAALLVFAAFEILLFWQMSVNLSDWNMNLMMKFGPTNSRFMEMHTQQQDLFWVNYWHVSRNILLVLLVAITGGFWATLLFRQTGAALWFVILVPGAISVALTVVSRFFSADAQDTVAFLTYALYSAAGFMWARRMFARAQDYQWLGESIAILDFGSTKVHDDAAVLRRKGALRALLRKEFQSHQISLIIAFGLLVMHICTLIFRGMSNPPRNSESRFVMEALPLLWLLIPWLMGCVAIAEERKLGTLEGQLCLPTNRRVQFGVKLIVVLFLGVFLGGIIPALVEGIGIRAGVASEIFRTFSLPGDNSHVTGLLGLVIVSGAITLISLFASSLTRNTLHALGAAVVFGIAWMFLLRFVADNTFHQEYSIWKGPLIFAIGVPAAIIATIALSFSNYKTLHAGRRVWLNALVAFAITFFLVGFAAAFIYARPWELMMTIEPQHGASQLTGPVHAAMATPLQRTVILLPDGRIWAATDYDKRKLDQDVRVFENGEYITRKEEIRVPSSGMFVSGSNWVELASSWGYGEVIGLQSDGTLWSILSYPVSRTNGNRQSNWLSQPPNPQRIGSDNDWKTVMAGFAGFAGIKTNGTLWKWWYQYRDRAAGGGPEKILHMEQIGTDSDWLRFVGRGESAVVIKVNGDVWSWRDNDYGEPRFARIAHNGADWANAGESILRSLVVYKDGTLWAAPSRYNWRNGHYFGHEVPGGVGPEFVRVGRRDDWLAVTGTPENLFGMKKDGRIVKNGTELFGTTLGSPSKYSDWLTFDAQGIQMFALAADGTLSMWADTHVASDGNIWLAPSRRPVWSLNILTDSKN